MFVKKQPLFLISLFTIIGGILHFSNLNWGAPFYFHPDERNIASAVSQLQFPNQMNPHFFAYGSLPIYAIYFTGVLANFFSSLLLHTPLPTFNQAILISRVYSALFATLLIPLLFILGKKLKDESTGILAAFFATVCVGFIQFAHFGTFEMWLTFFILLLFLNCLSLVKKQNIVHVTILALLFGTLIAIKISSIALLPLVLFLLLPFKKQKYSKNARQLIMQTVVRILFFFMIALFVYLITNPFAFLDTKDFSSSMSYESRVALGALPVFYTQNFLGTTPVIYQFLHMYPFLLNPLMTLLFIPTFLFLIVQAIRTKNSSYLLLITFYLILFLSEALLFVKWTRYMMPTIPFMLLTIAITLTSLSQTNTKLVKILSIEIGVLLVLNGLAAFSYFNTAFLETDPRIAAFLFAQKSLPVNIQILSEPSDLGVMPFQETFPHLTTFNFYDLDNHSPDATEKQLQQKLSSAQYIVLPSQRILQSRVASPQLFSKGSIFYKRLFNGNLGFHKIYETPCDIFCTIVYLGDPVYWWEQTASVFDRPTVFIFKRDG